jgi:CRISPR-associated protein Csm1
MSTLSLLEAAIGCFLHDMGKLWQRANGAKANMPANVLARESDILPSFDNRHTHIHALWTDVFFEEHKNLLPQGLNHSHIRNVAVYHHKPDSASADLCTQADRIASGMDRKPRDEEQEFQSVKSGAWDKFIKTPLLSCFSSIHLPETEKSGSQAILPLKQLRPDLDVFPISNPGPADNPDSAKYRELQQRITAELNHLAASNHSPDLFCEALLSISERYLSTTPSSTVDQPDISLHDHARAVAAVGAALYAFHQHAGTLADRSAIADMAAQKFVWVCADLSGIQSSLFRLESQQVRGVSKILRARSFLFGTLLDAALLEIRTRLQLPVFSVVLNAGGRFVLLAPNIPSIADKIQTVKAEIEQWLWNRYNGELAINIAVSQPFSGVSLRLEKFAATFQLAETALRAAKFNSFESITNPVHHAEYPNGACSACGIRPGTVRRDEDEKFRCASCADEERLGRALPKITYFGYTRQPESAARSIALFSGWHLEWNELRPSSLHRFASLTQLFHPKALNTGDVAIRFLANYVPRLHISEVGTARYQSLSDEARTVEPEDLKTFEHLAADALELLDEEQNTLIGEPFLAVLKADVDRLGLIFSSGIPSISLGRFSAVSRFIDFFFSAYLPSLLKEKYPSTYTVYAGGDDLLLIGPWRQTISLSNDIQREFTRWTASNPSITLSAAIELMKVNYPLNRSAANAEERLGLAKSAGRNRLSLIDELRPFTWPEVGPELAKASRLVTWLKEDKLSQAFIYRMLTFDADHRAAENTQHVNYQNAANWRSRWGYQIARNLPPKDPENQEIIRFLNSLLGLDQDLKKQAAGSAISPRTAVTISIYRTRNK